MPSIIKARAEGADHPAWPGSRICYCGAPIPPNGTDEQGERIYEDSCTPCLLKRIKSADTADTEFYERKLCRCEKAAPLPGMVWCLKCALAHQEKLRGSEPDDVVNARIERFKALAHPVSAAA